MMIDVDWFKHLNDVHGHDAGDQVLVALGRYVSSMIRQGDIACRYGGEEFLIIMSNVRLEELKQRAEALCQGVEVLSTKYGEIELRVTISIGVAVYPQHAKSLQEIIQFADAAMYAAKRAGRNQTYGWDSIKETDSLIE